jgi:hypothetical protein
MSRAYIARALGRLLVLAAGAVLLTVVAQQFLPGVFSVVGVIASVVVLVFAALAAVSLLMPPALLQLDAQGFRALKRRTSGPRSGRWDEVANAGTQHNEHGPVLIITHTDQSFTAVPLDLLDSAPDVVEREVRQRLDAAHGYKRLT